MCARVVAGDKTDCLDGMACEAAVLPPLYGSGYGYCAPDAHTATTVVPGGAADASVSAQAAALTAGGLGLDAGGPSAGAPAGGAAALAAAQVAVRRTADQQACRLPFVYQCAHLWALQRGHGLASGRFVDMECRVSAFESAWRLLTTS